MGRTQFSNILDSWHLPQPGCTATRYWPTTEPYYKGIIIPAQVKERTPSLARLPLVVGKGEKGMLCGPGSELRRETNETEKKEEQKIDTLPCSSRLSFQCWRRSDFRRSEIRNLSSNLDQKLRSILVKLPKKTTKKTASTIIHESIQQREYLFLVYSSTNFCFFPPKDRFISVYRYQAPHQPVYRYQALTGIPVSCLLYTSPSPRDRQKSRMPSSA